MLKSAAISVIRGVTRFYVRHMPWVAGKAAAIEVFRRQVAWRPYRTIDRLHSGDRMHLEMPDFVAGMIYVTGTWEPVISEYICSRLAPGDLFVDLGANIGYYSLLASRLVGPEGRVVSIEASPSTFRKLCANIKLNGRSNIEPINAAVSDGPGELPIYLGNPENLGHSTTLANVGSAEGMKLEATVRADSMESLVGSDLWGARFIKVDVEGAEAIVLSPLFSKLAAFSARTQWLIELTPDIYPNGQADVDLIYNAFRDAGYSCMRIPNGYSPRQYIEHRGPLVALNSPPTSHCDVVMLRQ
jgi:FkbM family methyltransferase